MDTKRTVISLYNEFRGTRGGTIHQALQEFRATLSNMERDSFISVLARNAGRISDLHHVQDFHKLNLSVRGIVIR